MKTKNALLRDSTREYLATVAADTSLEDIEQQLLAVIKDNIYDHNHSFRTAYKVPDRLDNPIIADVCKW